MPSDSSGVSALEFIRDQTGGAKIIQLELLSKQELQQLVWVFPEARKLYIERYVARPK